MTGRAHDETIHRGAINSPVGWIEVGVIAGAVVECRFVDRKPASAVRSDGTPLLRSALAAVQRYFEGTLSALDALPLKPDGTDFRKRVWQVLQKIPAGGPIAYGEVAVRVGSAGASRAVGSACGANPLCLFIPCHRVVARSGGLGGFSGGLWRKEILLQLEATQ